MKSLPLTHGCVALVDDEDFDRLNQWKWGADMRLRRDGSIIRIYAFRLTEKESVNGKRKRGKQYLHRAVLNMSDDDRRDVDHINHDGLDDRKCNLRPCTRSENNANARIPITNTSGHRGIIWNKEKRKWQARIKQHRRTKFLGYFDIIDDAVRAYRQASQLLRGEFSNA